MLKDVTGIRLQGANFSTPTSLQLFTKESNNVRIPSDLSRISLVYGKNGAGKSTIAHAFNKAAGKEAESIASSELIGVDGNSIQLTGEEQSRVYVFDESFVDRQVRFNSDGLDTVVMLGETGAIEESLSHAREELNTAAEDLHDKNELKNSFSNGLNPLSPVYWMKEMANRLKGNGNWAEREFDIRKETGLRRAPSVSDTTFEKFVNLKPVKTRDELILEYHKGLDELKEAQSGNRKITQPVAHSFSFSFDEEAFIALLALKLENPVLTDRERFLLSVMQRRPQGYIHNIKSYFEDDSHEICPFCFQDVLSVHKKALFASIEKVLNDAVKTHERELTSYRCEEVTISFDAYEALDKAAVNKCQAALNEFNTAIQLINNHIGRKLTDVYSPIVIESIDVAAKFDVLMSSLVELEKIRVEYNKQVSDIAPIRERLSDINANIAYYDLLECHKNYINQLSEQEKVIREYRQALSKHDQCNREVLRLEAQLENIEIAMNTINKWLQYIFFAENRLSLEYRDHKYYLKTRGNSVSPNKISVGERNAIAICYFFSNLMQGKSEHEVFSDSYLIFIDDPISSFDMENRIGMLSFLKYQLHRYLLGNKETKVIIMTHDIQAFYDIQKMSDEIVVSCRNHSNPTKKYCYSLAELNSQQLIRFKKEKPQEYTHLLNDVYDYALNCSQSLNTTIGNTMRRVLEAFSTFIYRKGIEDISTNEKILSELDPGISSYFENLMYKLVLNGESHMQERVNSMNSMDFFSYISDTDKQRTAQDVLSLLYCLNKRHVLEHLGNDKEPTLESWVSRIRQMG